MILQRTRGRLLATTFSPGSAHYSLLKDIGFLQQEKQAEIAAIQHAIDHVYTKANNIKPGHAREIVVNLAKNTFVMVTMLKLKKSLD